MRLFKHKGDIDFAVRLGKHLVAHRVPKRLAVARVAAYYRVKEKSVYDNW